MVMPTVDSFRTSDTALAAYLVAEGLGSPDIEHNGNRAFFSFTKSPKLDKAIESWDSARAKSNVVLFFNAYQSLLRRIKEGY